jgi:hypothetical protein
MLHERGPDIHATESRDVATRAFSSPTAQRHSGG